MDLEDIKRLRIIIDINSWYYNNYCCVQFFFLMNGLY
jgi:hypothetical protein